MARVRRGRLLRGRSAPGPLHDPEPAARRGRVRRADRGGDRGLGGPGVRCAPGRRRGADASPGRFAGDGCGDRLAGDGRGGDFRIRRAGHRHGARGGWGASAGTGGSRRGPGLSRLAGIGAFLPVGYPWAEHQTNRAARAVNEDMSYQPSHRKPPRQERWPNATPGEGWPAYQQGDGGRDWESAEAFAGSRNGYGTASNGYGDPWGGGTRYSDPRSRSWPARNGHRTTTAHPAAGDRHADAFHGAIDGYADAS